MAFSQAQASLDVFFLFSYFNFNQKLSINIQDILTYVQERKQFGKFLYEFQAVQLKLAEMKMKVEASRMLLNRAVMNSDLSPTKLPSISESSIAKCYANEMAVEVCSMAMQLAGGYGYSTQFQFERRMRDALGWRVAGGNYNFLILIFLLFNFKKKKRND